MEWNFILQGDEMQGMILIQAEGMYFQASNIWIFIKFFNNLWDNISCLKGVDYRGFFDHFSAFVWLLLISQYCNGI
jgi:hypothetical protein